MTIVRLSVSNNVYRYCNYIDLPIYGRLIAILTIILLDAVNVSRDRYIFTVTASE